MIDTDKLSSYWEYFDKIYCISLDERADRRETAQFQFQKVGLSDNVEFLIVEMHPHNCEQGIYESHMSCIKKGIQAGANNIVIFEDDILFDGFSPVILKNCIDFLSATPDWNVLFFGCLVADSKKTENKSVLRVKYRSLAHAYVINPSFAEIMVKKPWQGIPFDDFLFSINEGFYVAYPSFAFQSDSPTNNNKHLLLDKFRRLCGGLRRIQKINELYHSYRTHIIAFHIIILLVIVLLFL